MKIIKKILAIGVVLNLAATVSAADEIKITIDNKSITTDVSPVIENDRVLVPLRGIFENLGAEVFWDEETREVSAKKESTEIKIKIGDNILYKNGNPTELDTFAKIENERALVPLRAISESLSAKVVWDGVERMVYIINPGEDKIIPIEIEMYDGGVMKAELYPKVAPAAVKNFVELANDGFYDGLVFHRVIKDFMIQGGGYDECFAQRVLDPIVGEFEANGIENNLKHTRGVLSMARTYMPNSATCQFFIMHADASYLDGQYAAFGKLTDGFDVLDKIANSVTTTVNGMQDVPEELPVIKTIRVLE